MTWAEYRKTMINPQPIFDDVRNGDSYMVEQFISQGGDVNLQTSSGYSLLMLAAYGGHVEICEMLLDNGADSNFKDLGGNSVLMGAAFKGYSRIVRLLLGFGADPAHRNAKGVTALDFAKAFGREEVVSILAKRPLTWWDRFAFMKLLRWKRR